MIRDFSTFLIDELKDTFLGNPRADAFAALAKQKGFLYRKRAKFDLLPIEIDDFQLFHKLKSKKLENILQTRLNPDAISSMLIFDFIGKNDWGQRKATVLLAKYSNIRFPRMVIHPKSTYAKIGSWFSSADSSLDLYPTFKSKYSVLSPDISTLNTILKTDLQNVFIAEKDLQLEAEDQYLMIFKKGILLEPKEVLQKVSLLQQITEALYAEDERDYV